MAQFVGCPTALDHEGNLPYWEGVTNWPYLSAEATGAGFNARHHYVEYSIDPSGKEIPEEYADLQLDAAFCNFVACWDKPMFE